MNDQRDPRLFADDYSSTGQRAWQEGRRGTGPDYWRDDYLGQLRFDSLIASTLVVPDSHVFDGPFFLSTGPANLRAQLGRDGLGEHHVPAIEVRGRQATLEESLAEFLRRPDRETLNPFVFKTIEDETLRRGLAAELRRTPETELDAHLGRADGPAQGVARLLSECLLRVDSSADAEAVVEPLEAGWRRWLDEAVYVKVESWPTFTEFDIAGALAVEPAIDDNLRTDMGREVLDRVRSVVARGSGHRADISEVIAPRRVSAANSSNSDALSDLELIDTWYSRGRYRALAARHGCACALGHRPWLPPLTAGQALLQELRGDDEERPGIPLPDDVLTALGDLEADEFQAFIRAHRRTVRRWWRSNADDELKRLADGLANFAPVRDRPRLGLAQLLQPGGAGTGFGVGTAVGGPAAGSVLGGFIGAVGKLALDRRPDDSERIRMRVLEALRSRAEGLGSSASVSAGGP